MCDGFHSLSPIPPSGEGNSRFRCEVGELFKQVPSDRFSLSSRSEQIDEPGGNTWRLNAICWGGHEELRMRSRPALMLWSARWVRFTADTPLAVIRNKRFERPPRS